MKPLQYSNNTWYWYLTCRLYSSPQNLFSSSKEALEDNFLGDLKDCTVGISTDFVKRRFDTCFITVGTFGTHTEVLIACPRRSHSRVQKTEGGATEKASWGGRGTFQFKNLLETTPCPFTSSESENSSSTVHSTPSVSVTETYSAASAPNSLSPSSSTSSPSSSSPSSSSPSLYPSSSHPGPSTPISSTPSSSNFSQFSSSSPCSPAS